jgi:4,5-DOPA dioxygenase extradiol
MASPGNFSGRMPTLFVGHGTPMNAILDNEWTRAFKTLANGIPRPKAILSISGHFYTPGIYVTDNEAPPTIHDFGGFPQELFDIQYPCPGAPDLARRISEMLGGHAKLTDKWGLDHGTWSVLLHMYPKADIPVVQMSIDSRVDPEIHVAIGRELASLRDAEILILGTGNITHNMRIGFWQQEKGVVPDWSAHFDKLVADATWAHDANELARLAESEAGEAAHSGFDHYFPLLYVAGAAHKDDPVSYPITGFDRYFSMRAVKFG